MLFGIHQTPLLQEKVTCLDSDLANEIGKGKKCNSMYSFHLFVIGVLLAMKLQESPSKVVP